MDVSSCPARMAGPCAVRPRAMSTKRQAPAIAARWNSPRRGLSSTIRSCLPWSAAPEPARHAATRNGRNAMSDHPVFKFKFAKVYPMYVQKAERKGRTKEEVDEILRWFTGHDQAGLQRQIDQEVDLRSFIDDAPKLNPDRELIKGVVCGVRVENVEDPLMRELRYMDKLIDELAKGKKMERILRRPAAA